MQLNINGSEYIIPTLGVWKNAELIDWESLPEQSVLKTTYGGHEHYQLPSPRMKETYRFFVDAGADAVVNHHQHCYSGYEVYNGKPIFYGLGNFCFDNPKRKWYLE